MAVASTVYCLIYLGRWALLGAVVIVLYYPYQVANYFLLPHHRIPVLTVFFSKKTLK